ncbi:hypothetical protein GH714_019951 [Hevea brasiliensis]|uniref:Tf2-1-like SH3-like domain-containing protein n=1 Tax=Hevea brasiliensis TaxID=3981 RepID=A0A6A6N2J3_HEVBR|nr:hypothetical protein GH714_019951 [Hevea brasiliensis]
MEDVGVLEFANLSLDKPELESVLFDENATTSMEKEKEKDSEVEEMPPPRLLSYCPGHLNLDAVDNALQLRVQLLGSLRANLLRAQQKMKSQYDAHRRDVQFNEGDKVLLKLQPHRQLSVAERRHQKLLPKFHGPYTVVQLIGKMAYKLDLPPSTKIHPVFHVSNLKKFNDGQGDIGFEFPPYSSDQLQCKPLAILDNHVRAGQVEILVHWQHTSPADASWENACHLQKEFPNFVLEDKHVEMGGSKNFSFILFSSIVGGCTSISLFSVV